MPKELTQDLARRWVRYDPESGFAFWNPRSNADIAQPGTLNSWNKQYANKQLGFYDRDGYLRAKICSRQMILSRIIWFREFGEWPEQIDHINGIRDDNRLANLRAVTLTENCRNRSTPKTNKSGLAGIEPVYKNKRQTYRVRFQVGDKYSSYGSFEDFFEACCRRKSLELEFGFHPNHNRSRL